ncbi:DUF7828 domain-containing protein [Budvicia aquatica]|uniref:DUF7828 domain-containing protein n=1 Tax=Budvicia aquatica TaxID=82979 RepID=UPI003F65EF6E
MAQRYSDCEYTGHLCGSSLVFHRRSVDSRSGFEHTNVGLSEQVYQHCPLH